MDTKGFFFESLVDFMAGLFPFFAGFEIFLEDFFTGAGFKGFWVYVIKDALSGGALKKPKLGFWAAFLGVDRTDFEISSVFLDFLGVDLRDSFFVIFVFIFNF